MPALSATDCAPWPAAVKPGNLDELESPSIIAQGLTFETICLLLALGVTVLFGCGRRFATARAAGRAAGGGRVVGVAARDSQRQVT